jgi:hypothetical protein
MLGTHGSRIFKPITSLSSQSCYYNHYEEPPKRADNGGNDVAKPITDATTFLGWRALCTIPY